jgi:hypothetical protein
LATGYYYKGGDIEITPGICKQAGGTYNYGTIKINRPMQSTGYFDYPHIKLMATNDIDSTGAVGIVYPTSTADNYGIFVGGLRSSTNGTPAYTIRTHNNSATGNERLRLTEAGILHVDGDVIAYSATISDIRLKENLIPIDNALNIINKLRGYGFDWKYNKDGRHFGLIAQEVQGVLPEIVIKSESVFKRKENDTTEYLNIRSTELIPYLVEAIKEQQIQIEELKKCLQI